MLISVDGTWREGKGLRVAVDGTWRDATGMKVATDGTWKQLVGSLGGAGVTAMTVAADNFYPYTGWRVTIRTSGIVNAVSVYANGIQIWNGMNVEDNTSFLWHDHDAPAPKPGVPYNFECYVHDGAEWRPQTAFNVVGSSLAVPPAVASITVTRISPTTARVSWPAVADCQYLVLRNNDWVTLTSSTSADVVFGQGTNNTVGVIAIGHSVWGGMRTTPYVHARDYTPGWYYVNPVNHRVWSSARQSWDKQEWYALHGNSSQHTGGTHSCNFFYWSSTTTNPFSPIKSAIAKGGRLVEARIKVTRNNVDVHSNRGVNAVVQTHNHKRFSAGMQPSFSDNRVVLDPIKKSESLWMNLPLSLAQAVIDDSGRGITMGRFSEKDTYFMYLVAQPYSNCGRLGFRIE